MRNHSFVQQIRDAVNQSGMSRYSLAQASGVDEAALSRFTHGKGLSMESLDAIGRVLGLAVVVREPWKPPLPNASTGSGETT